MVTQSIARCETALPSFKSKQKQETVVPDITVHNLTSIMNIFKLFQLLLNLTILKNVSFLSVPPKCLLISWLQILNFLSFRDYYKV